MRGAILGDIAGSPWEFNGSPGRRETFPLFSEQSKFTDDSVMTIAVAEGLMRNYGNAAATEQGIIEAMRKYGRWYPDAGYGSRFSHWIFMKEPKPCQSFGNGSAMRVSAAAWLYHSLSEVEQYAKISARVTHDHPEGLKGAMATAAAIFLARRGRTKTEIKQYIEEKYRYDLDRKRSAGRAFHHMVSCQEAVPAAMIAFLEGRSFEDVIRRAIVSGDDSDTLAAIAGSIAEAYYGVSEKLWKEAEKRLDDRLKDRVAQYDKFLHEMEQNL